MKYTLLSILSVLFITSVTTLADNNQNNTSNGNSFSNVQPYQATFFNSIKDSAVSIANKNDLFPSIMMAQAALESGYGTSSLAVSANNYFGIKGNYQGQSNSMNTSEYGSNGAYNTTANFRKYPSPAESLQDYATFLNTPRYSNVHRSVAGTYQIAAQNLVQDGYATDPNYSFKLIKLINDNALFTFDNNSSNNNSSNNSSSNNDQNNNSQNDNSSNINQNSSSNNNNSAQNKPKQPVQKNTLATATYFSGSHPISVTLSNNFSKYNLYNHVKDTRKKVTKYKWFSNLRAGNIVNVDLMAVQNHNGKNSIWYRLDLHEGKSTKKYWVYNKAVVFPKINYQKVNKQFILDKFNPRDAYNHVYSYNKMAMKIDSSINFQVKKVFADMEATFYINVMKATWYRINVKGYGKVWIDSNGLINTEKNAKYYPENGTKTLSSNYKKFKLYNHIPGTNKNEIKQNWNGINLTDKVVSYDLKGVRVKYATVWYRIFLNNKSYWISSQAFAQ
ncbi:glycoside hydrolase family 73 protein [Apilactobacillus xinyiensis]|uniref:glycoside hydrolase family 73 protein n=1 Tax=Apilactobacillus xinyiensis TaxID=2841032 RepID=UPI00200D2E91|nr:glucosaminidase domain-containing protein [Apilactobacillus xinyiensis]MCL0330105.1 glucosaminidase domain-containing protein [Apilactobacillus xinyiensis]